MAAGDIKAGAAYVELFTQRSRLTRGLNAASRQLTQWGTSVTAMGAKIAGVGGAALAPFLGAARTFASVGSAMDRLSKATGQPVEDISRLVKVAQRAGVEVDDISGSVEELQLRLGEAVRDGTGPLSDTFEKLGIDAQQFAKLPVGEQFAKLADILNDLPTSQRQFIADEIFGGDAFRILPLLAKGGDELRESLEGVAAWSEEDAKAATAMQEAWNTLTGALKQATVRIGAALAPALTSLAETITKVVDPLITWIDENRELTVTVAAVAAGVVVAGTAFAALGLAISGVGAALGVVSTILGILLSPVGLLVAGVIALVAAFVDLRGIGEKIASLFGTRFSKMADTVKRVLGGIVDAIKAGDMKRAADIMWTALRLAWLEGTTALQQIWDKFIAQVKLGLQEWLDPFADSEALFQQFLKDIEESERALKPFRQEAARLRKELDQLLAVQPEADATEQEIKTADRNLRRDPVTMTFEAAGAPYTGPTGAAGTFSARAAELLGLGGNAAERTAKATEKTADNTERMADELEAGGQPVWQP
jgi:TP901 family phage tail tape measure protein